MSPVFTLILPLALIAIAAILIAALARTEDEELER